MMLRNKSGILQMLRAGALRSESHMAMLSDSLTQLRASTSAAEEQTDRLVEAIMRRSLPNRSPERLLDSGWCSYHADTIKGLDKVLNLENIPRRRIQD